MLPRPGPTHAPLNGAEDTYGSSLTVAVEGGPTHAPLNGAEDTNMSRYKGVFMGPTHASLNGAEDKNRSSDAGGLPWGPPTRR